ncbi:hypothetical protein N39L_03490 [Limnospira platensis NIES-39]|nr:hypothetical protein N39L_03490 [Arthrospira platensis NIES-39]
MLDDVLSDQQDPKPKPRIPSATNPVSLFGYFTNSYSIVEIVGLAYLR